MSAGQYYIGVKIVFAWEEERDGIPGYGMEYPDGYKSWSPKEVFEDAYLGMGPDSSAISEPMVDRFVRRFDAQTLNDNKTTLIDAELITGFRQYETSSCVNPRNYSQVTGLRIGTAKIKDAIWSYLGFVLQWGLYGLKGTNKEKGGN